MRGRKISKELQKAFALLLIVLMVGCVFLGDFNVAEAEPAGGQAEPSTEPDSSLPSDPTQSDQMQALGLSPEQPARLSPSNKEVDKSQSPLGPSRINLDRINQLAISGIVLANGGMMLLENPVTEREGSLALNPISRIQQPGLAPNWSGVQKATTAADIDGNGKQEVVSVGLVMTNNGISVRLYVTDYDDVERHTQGRAVSYSAPKVSSVFTVATNLPVPQYTVDLDRPMLLYDNFKVVAGDFDRDGTDEVAISVGDRVYICKVDMTGITIVSSRVFDRTIGDLKSADASKDRFPELLVTLAGSGSSGPFVSDTLFVFAGTDLARPDAEIPLRKARENEGFSSASVDVGDLLGEGETVIIIGGYYRTGRAGFTGVGYLRYSTDTESYDPFLEEVYPLFADFAPIKGRPDIRSVSLKTPLPGEPSYITMGGYIFKYNQTERAFERHDVTQSANSSGISPTGVAASQGNITNINVSRHATYIMQTLVGNFDGNNLGEKQIVLLHYTTWHNRRIMYITVCSLGSDDRLGANLTQVSEIQQATNQLWFPAIAAPDIFNAGVTLEFIPEMSHFAFSEPAIIAVLAAPPYYEELTDYYQSLGNDGTTYGTTTETGQSVGNGVTAEVGVSFGFEQEFAILGVKIGGVEFEASVTTSFSSMWSKATSISKSLSFTTMLEDAVVLTVVPYDFYYYRVFNRDRDNPDDVKETIMVMQVPYEPLTTIMPVTRYNETTKYFDKAPIIGNDVIMHTPGNPRTYPQSTQGLTNIAGRDVLTGGSFIGSGIGPSVVNQSISTSVTDETSFDYAVNVDVSLTLNLLGVKTGVSAGIGYAGNVTITTTATTERSGTVASVPAEFPQYQFEWQLVAYNYKLAVDDSTQQITVISYLVRPLGAFPPEVPDDFRIGSRTLKQTTLQWNPAEGAAGYRILRARALDENPVFVNISGNLAGKNTVSFTDTELQPGQNYLYRIVAYASREAAPTPPLRVNRLEVTQIRVRNQPKLSYKERDALDLSGLTVRLVIPNNPNEDVPFDKFADYGITTSLAHGLALRSTDSGVPISVTYTHAKVMVNTNNLTVAAISPYDLDMIVSFRVGTTDDAVALRPNQTLRANIELRNDQPVGQRVLLILALYSDKGNMVQSTHISRLIGANTTRPLSLTLSLPADVRGYVAKVFVWDEADLMTTTLTPKAKTVSIPH